ncbi:glutamate dehydrogenase, partial [Alistipes putredinis]|nr:glutamate dehydrogenase [Alistipes putredinis]
GETWGGSILRPEATGFGALYFEQHMLHLAGKKLEGAKIAISGFGNVAWGASKKAPELGAKVIAISGPDGVVTIPTGMNEVLIDYMLELRASNRNIVAPFAEKFAG